MNQRNIYIVGIIFVLLIAAMFAFAYIKRSQLASVSENTPQEEKAKAPQRIDAKHYYSEGTHTIAGEVLLPTQCDLINSSVDVVERTGNGDPMRVRIALNVINDSDTNCEPAPIAGRFKESFDAPKDIVIEATFDGEDAILNLVDALPGETPEEFELYIKG